MRRTLDWQEFNDKHVILGAQVRGFAKTLVMTGKLLSCIFEECSFPILRLEYCSSHDTAIRKCNIKTGIIGTGCHHNLSVESSFINRLSFVDCQADVAIENSTINYLNAFEAQFVHWNIANLNTRTAKIQKLHGSVNLSSATIGHMGLRNSFIAESHLDACTAKSFVWRDNRFCHVKISNISCIQSVLMHNFLHDCEFANCDLPALYFSDSDVLNTKFESCMLAGAKINGRFINCSFSKVDFRQAEFAQCDFVNCKFSNSVLSHAVFDECTFVSCHSEHCKTTGTLFMRSEPLV